MTTTTNDYTKAAEAIVAAQNELEAIGDWGDERIEAAVRDAEHNLSVALAHADKLADEDADAQIDAEHRAEMAAGA